MGQAKDNSVKTLVENARTPSDGDLLRYNSTLNGWEPVDAADVIADVVASQAFTDAVQAVIDAQ